MNLLIFSDDSMVQFIVLLQVWTN